MTGFDDREKALEAKFEHDEEVAFKVRSRRRRLLGLWAAEHLGLTGSDAQAYADELAALGLHRHGDDEAIQRIADDFAAKGVALDIVRIKLECDRFEREAKAQLG
ncbi:MAG TPA: DUF1476 domain-containing protein [Stellaceae bacterium]|nr:DUF1476 domain-containing protein [Stellaceae bacterium]